MTIQHQYQDSPEKSSTIEKPPEVKELHRHEERDELRAELRILKINYQHALNKVAELSKERDELLNQNRNLNFRAYYLSQDIDLLEAKLREVASGPA